MFNEKILRHFHRGIGYLVCIPMIITIITGTMLILRSYFPWVQPASIKQEVPKTWISMEKTLDLLLANPKSLVKSWKDVKSVKISPNKGLIQVRTKQGLQIQMNGGTGNFLEIAPRRTSFIIKLHEGSYWSPMVRDFIVLPSAIGLLLLILSGMMLLFNHLKRKKASKAMR
ncbi:PepSY domain-containing protein [bacterium]|nr:PepSY domain-containing protein [bacterium]